MTEPEKNELGGQFPDLHLEDLTDEEILQLFIQDCPESTPGPAISADEPAGKALQGLRLIREAVAVATGRSGEQLRELLGNGLSGRLGQVSESQRGSQYDRGSMIAGRYRLVSLIGEGGMGSVWVAEQRVPVRRRVALKLIKPGMDSRQVLHRFEAERQALAAMDHPNIARILDGGLADNQHPFFAMELVNGASLTKFCDEARLGIRERLEIFRQIAQAIQHAHHRGILHRDLKPSNILVTVIDGTPVPKVIDFGLAKVLGSQLHADSMQTKFGAVVGTIEYMAPEQAGYSGQDVDTRADIYSLGVILYELLTGLPPFDSDRLASVALDEMLRIIKDEDPVRPSVRLASSVSAQSCAEARRIEPAKLSGILRNELDWIVMKALDKDRNRRYETANGLAADIQNYLAGEPVSAHPPSAFYRIRKFARRHRVQVIAASLVSLAMIIGVAGLAVGFFHARKQERIAVEQGKIAMRQEQIAVAESKAKSEALLRERDARENEKEARDQALIALRSMTDEFIQNELARETPISRKEQTYLHNVIRQFDVFASFAADETESQAIHAEGRFRVGRIYCYLSETADAEIELLKSVDIYAGLVRDCPDNNAYQRGLARSRGALGKVLVQLGKTTDACVVLDAAHRFWKEIASAAPTETNLESFADVCISIARLSKSLARLDDAEESFREALTIRQQLAENFPRPENRESLASGMNGLASLCRQIGKDEEAEKLVYQSLAIRKQIARRFSARPDFVYGLSASLIEIGQVAIANRQWDQAESSLQEARGILEDLTKQFPSKSEYHQQLADILCQLSKVFENVNRDRESMNVLAQAITIREGLAAETPERPALRKNLATLKFDLGSAYRRLGMDQEAESTWQQTISLRDSLASEFADDSENAMELARVLVALGQLHNSAARSDEAVKYYERAVNIGKECVSRHPGRIKWRKLLASRLLGFGRILIRSARADESESVLLESRLIWEQLASENPNDQGLQSNIAGCSIDLGNAFLQRHNYETAGQYFAEASSLTAQGLALDSTNASFRAMHTRVLFFVIQLQAGKLDEAKSLETANELRDLGWDPPKNAYFAACGLARSVLVMSGHSLLDDKQREEAVLRYSNLAMQYLTDAVSKGYASRKILVNDTDLDSIRGREDFQKLLDSLPATDQAETSN